MWHVQFYMILCNKMRHDYHNNFRKKGIAIPSTEILTHKFIIDASNGMYFVNKFLWDFI